MAEGLDLFDRYVRVVPDAALGWSPVDVVVDSKPGEHLDGVVVHEDGKRHRELPFAFAEHPGDVGIQPEDAGGDVELLLSDLPGIGVAGIRLGESLARSGLELLSHCSSCLLSRDLRGTRNRHSLHYTAS